MPIYESIGTAENISCEWVTTAGTFDPVFSNRSLRAWGSGYARIRPNATTQNAWFRTFWYTPDSPAMSSGPIFQIWSSTENLLCELSFTTSFPRGYRLSYRNGGILVTHGIFPVINDLSTYMLDFHVVVSNTVGRVEVYVDDIILFNFTGLNNGTDNIDRYEMYPASRFDNTSLQLPSYGSEFLVGIGENSPTVGRRVFSRFPLADSVVNNTWIGGAVQINTGARRADGDMTYTDSAGQREGFTISPAPILNARIEAVGLSVNAFIGDGSPRQLRQSVRIGGVDYDQSLIVTNRIPTFHETVLYQNPATLGAWTVPAFNGAEWGFIST
jgi:hypothetical protein